ncbi:aspartyl protease family protein At5g10770 [Arachis ipaensis]|uniref:aspartyl protease family protein At5g10770 n=1 Tax=Arachis ipaensis TaxID=130454 RepID=UPI0007AFADE0|nr:aspartyl protease family protein At5g10770 [Arachis ipaensis]
MAEATTALPVLLSLVGIYLIILANEVHSFEEMTFNLNMRKSQRKQNLGCHPPEARKVKGAIILEMKDTGHCSSVSEKRSHRKQLAQDDLRVRAIQSRIRGASASDKENKNNEIPISSGMKLETLNYVVTLGLGGQNVSMIVDTGSDLTWVQCQPCDSCYDQQGPLFQPSSSPSYQSILCNSTTCRTLIPAPPGACATATNCDYVVNYGDGSYTSGELGVEHLSIGGVWITDFVFGCGRNNKGLFGLASGLMGLGRSHLSIVSQTSSTLGGVFSYCLPSPDAGASGSLVMGNDSSSLFKNVAYARMLSDPQLSSFYILNLTTISVGGVPLLQASSFGKGTLIDSGTVITRLAPSMYRAVKAEFLRQFSDYPSAPGFSILDTCFNLTGYEEVNIPSIRLYFEEVSMNVDVSGILYVVKEDASRVCLALASLSDEYDTPIVGNYQQRNQRVIYDTKNNRLGFAADPCTFTFN